MRNISSLWGSTSVWSSELYHADEKHVLRVKGHGFIGRDATKVMRYRGCDRKTLLKKNNKKNGQCSVQHRSESVHRQRMMRAGQEVTWQTTLHENFQLLLDFECWMSHWSVISGEKKKTYSQNKSQPDTSNSQAIHATQRLYWIKAPLIKLK